MAKEFKSIIRDIMNKHNNTLKKLADGPNGEYHHSLEKRLAEEIEKNKKLKEENDKLRELLRKL